MNAKFNCSFAVLLLLAGCKSAKDAKETTMLVGGVATMAALSPFVPVVEGYHVITGDREKMKAKIEAINARFDPISEKKIAAILRRDPIADAQALYRDGVVALLPSVPGLTIYPGLESARYDVGRVVQYPSVAQQSVLYRELEASMDPYSEDFRQNKDEPRYYSSVFIRFIHAEGAYKVEFNREIYRLEIEKKPNRVAGGI